MALAFRDLALDTYLTGYLPVHVIAFRPNPGKKLADIEVTDYTRDGSSAFPVREGRVVFANTEKLLLKIPYRILRSLVKNHQERTGELIFEPEDVDEHASGWINCFQGCLFVNLNVRLRVGQPPSVTGASLLSSSSNETSSLWRRFIDAISGRVLVNKRLVLAVIGPALSEAEQRLLGPDAEDQESSTSPANNVQTQHEVKEEADDTLSQSPSEILEAQKNFQMSLKEAESMGRGRIGLLPRGQTETVPARSIFDREPEILTQLPDLATQRASEAKKQNGINGINGNGQNNEEDERSDSQYSGEVFQDANGVSDLGSDHVSKQNFNSHLHKNDSQSRSPMASQQEQETQLEPPYHSASLLTQIGAPFTTQNSDSDFSDDEDVLSQTYRAQIAGVPVSLAQLARLPLKVDHRPFKVVSKIVGTFPDDLSLICVKPYIEKAGTLALGDPCVRGFELILSDCERGPLTRLNSIRVHVPATRVLALFGCQHVEQLYTQMEAKQAQLAKLYSVAITIDVSVGYAGRSVMWVLKDASRISVLSKELV